MVSKIDQTNTSVQYDYCTEGIFEMTDFRALADVVAADIRAGRLKPGDRLPPQREFAFKHGIAASTAGRVYAELVKRGLIAGEVGRGTYVRAPLRATDAALAEPASAPVDLEFNFPILPQQLKRLTEALTRVNRPSMLGEAVKPVGATATPEARAIASRFMARGSWCPDPSGILFAGNGRQAIAAAMAALASPGDCVGVEAITYPVVKGIAARLGVRLIPLSMDEDGLLPDAILHAHRATPLAGLYVQPTLHNPLGTTMSQSRRRAFAKVLAETGLFAIEDGIYSFLADDLPIAALSPDRIIFIDSFSKRIAPGLTLGLLASPSGIADRIAGALRAGGWSAAGFPLMVGLHLMSDGTADQIGMEKRDDAKLRQQIAREALSGLDVRGDGRAFHLWLELPDWWRAEAFCASAARRGIAVAPASAFTVAPGHSPPAVRIALASPRHDVLSSALYALRQLAEGLPEQVE